MRPLPVYQPKKKRNKGTNDFKIKLILAGIGFFILVMIVIGMSSPAKKR
jgi:hypothetical protein